MRINNNMLAINTHRQMGGVALMQAKSMEKLSSGYRINRAGDDAAGLAISEKMRAQIRGLHTAAKNAQDGVSLIQTAEGSLQEVHSMLNRMVELATQSANGTFDDAVDRKNLESEVIALKDEIDRVAKSANFNGIKLLDGSLGDGTSAGKVRDITVNGVTAATAVTETDKTAGTFETQATLTAIDAAKTSVKHSFKYTDESGQENRIDIEFATADTDTKATGTVKLNGKVVAQDKDIDLKTEATLSDNVKKLLEKVSDFNDLFDVVKGADNGKLKFTNKTKGATRAAITEVLSGKVLTANIQDLEITSLNVKVTAGKNVKTTVDTQRMAALGTVITQENIDKAIIIVDGEKFAAVQKAALNDPAVLKALKENGVSEKNIIWDDDATSDKDSVQRMVDRINEVFGKDTAVVEAGAERKIVFEAKGAKGSTKGLTLQVGDTNDSFQKLTVSVGDMSSRGLGIGSVSVADQGVAASSIAKIKDAINSVSSTRGDLGALQNRLEHTIANINTTAENITASESRIRDVDMAKEMVELTKANILQQAAQAMLAQANQAPQGVLQLLR